MYDKDAALVQDKQSALKLLRVGEAVYEDGKWQINDESVSDVIGLTVGNLRSYDRFQSASIVRLLLCSTSGIGMISSRRGKTSCTTSRFP